MKKKHLNKPKLREMYKIPVLLKLFKFKIKKKKRTTEKIVRD